MEHKNDYACTYDVSDMNIKFKISSKITPCQNMDYICDSLMLSRVCNKERARLCYKIWKLWKERCYNTSFFAHL